MRVYLDNCCYNRPYDSQIQTKVRLETEAKLHIQDLIKTGQIEMVSSYALLYENSRSPYLARKEAIDSFIYENSSLYVSPENHKQIASKAREIMKTGVKYKDALHVAAAIKAECDFLLTTDIRLLKYNTNEIRICSPVEFVTQMEEDSDD